MICRPRNFVYDWAAKMKQEIKYFSCSLGELHERFWKGKMKFDAAKGQYRSSFRGENEITPSSPALGKSSFPASLG